MALNRKAHRTYHASTNRTFVFALDTQLQGTSLDDAVKAVRRGRGPQVEPRKVAISIRLNPKIVAHFKAGGAGWQSRMEKALLKASAIKV